MKPLKVDRIIRRREALKARLETKAADPARDDTLRNILDKPSPPDHLREVERLSPILLQRTTMESGGTSSHRLTGLGASSICSSISKCSSSSSSSSSCRRGSNNRSSASTFASSLTRQSSKLAFLPSPPPSSSSSLAKIDSYNLANIDSYNEAQTLPLVQNRLNISSPPTVTETHDADKKFVISNSRFVKPAGHLSPTTTAVVGGVKVAEAVPGCNGPIVIPVSQRILIGAKRPAPTCKRTKPTEPSKSTVS